jgi:DinB family.
MALSASVKSRLQFQHETIHELLKGFSEDYLKQRIREDKWSVHEQVAHLVTYQPLFLQRVKTIEKENSPLFERYVADNDPAFLAACGQPMPVLLNGLQMQRSEIIEYLLAVPYEILGRTGRHPKYGLLTITEWTEFFLLHEAHHLFSIFMLTRAGT